MNTVRCYCHPGGAADLPEDQFAPSDRSRVSAPCRKCRQRTNQEREQARKNGTYVPKARRWAPQKPKQAQPNAVTDATTELISPARFVKIGGYFIAENTVLIADALQEGKVTLFTTILEIDGDTKHPRNKKLIFTRQHSPDEYRATIAWLNAMAGEPALAVPSMNEQAAMQLAEEATTRLASANKQIEELKAKIAQFKTLLD